MEDGYIRVEEYDKTLGRNIEKVIDINGKEKFHSEYSSIRSYMPEDAWEVSMDINGERKSGLIDRDGNVLLPCKYDFKWNGLSVKKKRIIVEDGDHVGVIDLDGNIIIPTGKYDEITGVSQSLFCVYKKDENGNKLAGLVTHEGKELVPPTFKRISLCEDNYIICVGNDTCTMMKFTPK